MANDEKTSDNSFIESYLVDFKNSDIQNFNYEDGTPVNETTKKLLYSLIENKEFTKLKDFISDNQISLSFEENKTLKLSTYNTRRSENVTHTKRQYHLKYGYYKGKKTGYRKEWSSLLTCRATIDTRNGKVLSTNGASISYNGANFGTAFTPYMSNASTSHKVTGFNTVYFTGSYNMYAKVKVKISGIPLGATLDFGGAFTEYRGKL